MDIKPSRVATVVGDIKIDHALATLVLDFGTDPIARWLYGAPHHYLMHIPESFRALGTSSFDAGAAERTVDGLGVTLWNPLARGRGAYRAREPDRGGRGAQSADGQHG